MNFFKNNHPKIETVLINAEKYEIDKQKAYSTYQEEKSLRGFYRSNVNKLLTNENLVIIDSINYIKGFRYELFVLCRTMKTRHCVLMIDADIFTVKEHNQKSKVFNEDLLQDLFNRMERPNEKNRWDKPLFGILPEDMVPNEDIYEALFENK